MPLFEFRCEDCTIVHEALCSHTVEEIECDCGGVARKIISRTGPWSFGVPRKEIPVRNENGTYSFKSGNPPPEGKEI